MSKRTRGFGQSQPSIRDAKRFMLAFWECWAKAKGDQTQIHQFLQANLDQLNESLLEALPLVFTAMTKEQSATAIATLFVAFGNATWQFPLGDRWLNLELSIASYQLSLKVFTRLAFPENWATSQNDLGVVYRDRIRGERAENLEQAIAHLENALQVYKREIYQKEWAAIQNNFGLVYSVRIRGNRAENLEKAITAYENALQIYAYDTLPNDWAGTQNNLGNAYRNRIFGDRAENLEKAITAYENALQIYTNDSFLEKWALIQNNLGNVYCERLRGNRAENLEKAIIFHENALQIYTNESFLEKWAMAQNNLGNAYLYRIQGDRTENLEKAIAAFKLALKVYTYESFPEKWAMIQGNLGNAYREIIGGDRVENLAQAITVYENTLQIYARQRFPQDWARTQSDLAEALIQLAALTENVSDLDTAITLLQEALEVAVPGSPDFIDSQYRLGNALSRRYDHSHNPTDLQQALEAYKTALDAISPEHYDRKQIWQALPTTQSILGSRLVRDGKWQEGLQLLLNSVRQLSWGDDLLAHANALFQTGRAYEILSDWNNARLYYRDALRLYNHLNNQSGIARSQAGLGSVLVSQGYLEKGMAELAKARDCYQQLQQPDKVAEVNQFYQSIQRVLQQQAEVYS